MLKGERGGLIMKVAIFLVFLALCGWEAGSILVARVQADRTAVRASEEAAAEYANSQSTTKARDAAELVVKDDGGELLQFEVNRTAGTVRVTIRRRARTIIIQRIGALKKHGVVVVTHDSKFR